MAPYRYGTGDVFLYSAWCPMSLLFWSFLIKGSATRIQNGEKILVEKGDFWCTPGGIKHGIIGGPEGATIFDIFAPQREEYKKPGSGFAAD